MNLVAYLIGVFTGVGLALSAGYYLERRERKRRDARLKKEMEAQHAREQAELQDTRKALDELISTVQKGAAEQSVSDRLRKAMEITAKQGKIDPHGGDEQTLLYNNLELEKLAILKAILKDGYDPVITVRYSKGDQQMALSQYIANIQRTLH